MARFLKPPGVDARGYDAGLNKQTLSGVAHYATVGLIDGENLAVTPNDSSVAQVTEQKAQGGMRIFRVTGLKTGYSMLEAKDRAAVVKAFMQIHVAGSGGKQILVDLASQTVEAIENGERKYLFDCVTGDQTHPTNKGTFHITLKHRIHRSTKYNAQMNYAMFFTADGKAIHQYHGIVPLSMVRVAKSGVSDFFGSHGCVRLNEENAAELFEWAPLNTKVTVK